MKRRKSTPPDASIDPRVFEPVPCCANSSQCPHPIQGVYLTDLTRTNAYCDACRPGSDEVTYISCRGCNASRNLARSWGKRTSDIFVRFIGCVEHMFCHTCAANWTHHHQPRLCKKRYRAHVTTPRRPVDIIEIVWREQQAPMWFLLTMKRLGYPLPRDILKAIYNFLQSF